MAAMRHIVLYAVGSPLVTDAEESCERLGKPAVAGVRNRDGPVYTSSRLRIVSPGDIDEELRTCEFLIALFTPAFRKSASEEAWQLGFAGAATVIDPTTPVARSAEIDHGVFVNAGGVIGGGCRIGSMVLINRSASIGHHTVIADYVSIGPGAVIAGSVRIGRGSVIGAGAIVLPEVSIGENAVVAAGAVVREDVPDAHLVAGNPARLIKSVPGYRGLAV